MLIDNTPVIVYPVGSPARPVWVKREDLCSPYPGPQFSKIRGVLAHLRNRPEQYIGVLDTKHSKAGWAVSYVCRALGKTAVNYWPRYVAEKVGALRTAQQQAAQLGAQMVELKAGRSAILYHHARKHLQYNYPNSYLMPNALKLPESVTENAAEAVRTRPGLPDIKTVVISISSGTVAAGVMKGLGSDYHYILHLGYDRSEDAARQYMERVSDLDLLYYKHEFVNEKYSYADAAPKGAYAPFPCNAFYDLKAWAWLNDNIEALKQPVLFWNVGA